MSMSTEDLVSGLKKVCKELCPLCKSGWIPDETSANGHWEHRTSHFNPLEPSEPCIAGPLWSFLANLDEEKEADDKAKINCLLAIIDTALRQSGCDGDLCAYQWHEDARQVLSEAVEAREIQ
jgi:hypothetical protein